MTQPIELEIGPAHASHIERYVAFARAAPVAFFALGDASPWWSDGRDALYLSGIVVDRAQRGHGVGRAIVAWAVDRARARRAQVLRLDCHSGNRWLRDYYERLGFVERARIEQHPGYTGCLYERLVEHD